MIRLGLSLRKNKYNFGFHQLDPQIYKPGLNHRFFFCMTYYDLQFELAKDSLKLAYKMLDFNFNF